MNVRRHRSNVIGAAVHYGPTIPMVRDISGAGSVDYGFDGMDSSLDATSGCERREPTTLHEGPACLRGLRV